MRQGGLRPGGLGRRTDADEMRMRGLEPPPGLPDTDLNSAEIEQMRPLASGSSQSSGFRTYGTHLTIRMLPRCCHGGPRRTRRGWLRGRLARLARALAGRGGSGGGHACRRPCGRMGCPAGLTRRAEDDDRRGRTRRVGVAARPTAGVTSPATDCERHPRSGEKQCEDAVEVGSVAAFGRSRASIR